METSAFLRWTHLDEFENGGRWLRSEWGWFLWLPGEGTVVGSRGGRDLPAGDEAWCRVGQGEAGPAKKISVKERWTCALELFHLGDKKVKTKTKTKT